MAQFIKAVQRKEEDDGFWETLGDIVGGVINVGGKIAGGALMAAGHPAAGMAVTGLGGALGGAVAGQDAGAAIATGIGSATQAMPVAYESWKSINQIKQKSAEWDNLMALAATGAGKGGSVNAGSIFGSATGNQAFGSLAEIGKGPTYTSIFGGYK